RHRYYNPNTGRFQTPDPIGLAGGLNNYQYVPNPTGWVDPLGLASQKTNCPESGSKVPNNATSGFTQLSSQSRRYLNDLEAQTGFKVTADQRTNLANALREQEFTKLSPDLAKTHRAEFNRVKDDLITQWEQSTGQAWPRYTEDVLAKNGVT